MKTSKREFWEVLKSLAGCRPHYFTLSAWIRFGGLGSAVCPICAVANDLVGYRGYTNDYLAAAQSIGLDMDFAESVARAADSADRDLDRYHRAIKTQIIKVLSL